jgi:hypothetical protein
MDLESRFGRFEQMAKATRLIIFSLSVFAMMVWLLFMAWYYTSTQLSITRTKGVYPSAEEGMIAKLRSYYAEDADIKILHAGPDLHSGKQAYVWYVIAEVRASARADGSELGQNGCDAPGSFFVQTKEGWMYVPELVFPHFLGFWMNAFGLAGPGVSAPTTDWPPGQPSRFCQPP